MQILFGNLSISDIAEFKKIVCILYLLILLYLPSKNKRFLKI